MAYRGLTVRFFTQGPLVNPLVAQPPSHDFTRLGPAEVDATVRIRLEAAMVRQFTQQPYVNC